MEKKDSSKLESVCYKSNQTQFFLNASASLWALNLTMKNLFTTCLKCLLNRCPCRVPHDISSFPSLLFANPVQISSLDWWQLRASSCWPQVGVLELPTVLFLISAGCEGSFSPVSMFLPHFHSLRAWLSYAQRHAWGLDETPGPEK